MNNKLINNFSDLYYLNENDLATLEGLVRNLHIILLIQLIIQKYAICLNLLMD